MTKRTLSSVQFALLAAALFCLISAGIYIARSDSPVLTVPSILSKTTHPHIEPDATPHGPYWLNEDFGFYPIPTADGRNVSLLMSFKYRDKETWPLPPGQEIYCRGEKNVEWSRMELRQGLMEPPPHEHINIFTCAASGKSMTFKHVSPAGDRYLTIPLGSVRARMSDPPMVIAWTMVNGWTPLIPLWLEYQLAHGIEEIYIYNNEDDYDAKQTLTMNLASYIVAGLVIIVPWYKSWHGHLLGDWWVSQQIAAVNHALRSFDGYAEWVLFADIDEYPLLGDKEPFDLFSYPSILAAEREEDPTLACVFMRHVFGRDLSETAPTVETALGPLRGFSPKIVRQREYYNDHDRSKWFAHPPRVPLASIHEPSRWTGTRKTLDPSTSMWTLHLSDHPEREGPEVELDFSRLAPQMDDLLRARWGG